MQKVRVGPEKVRTRRDLWGKRLRAGRMLLRVTVEMLQGVTEDGKDDFVDGFSNRKWRGREAGSLRALDEVTFNPNWF
jgi:hypothetical protein